jgi:hypothetical protein
MRNWIMQAKVEECDCKFLWICEESIRAPTAQKLCLGSLAWLRSCEVTLQQVLAEARTWQLFF